MYCCRHLWFHFGVSLKQAENFTTSTVLVLLATIRGFKATFKDNACSFKVGDSPSLPPSLAPTFSHPTQVFYSRTLAAMNGLLDQAKEHAGHLSELEVLAQESLKELQAFASDPSSVQRFEESRLVQCVWHGQVSEDPRISCEHPNSSPLTTFCPGACLGLRNCQ